MHGIRAAIAIILIAGALGAQINSSIPLGVNPPNITSPLDTLQKIQQIQETRERIRQLQEQTRQAEDQRATSQRQQQEAEKRRTASGSELHLTMKQLLGEDGFKLTGLYVLSSEQLTILDKWVSLYSADLAKRFSAPPVLPSAAVESEINGEFHGWSGDTTFELANGQVWQQSAYDYEYEYDYRPKVVVYSIGSVFKMKVDGVKGAVEVRRVK
jgi:hypothetical protein